MMKINFHKYTAIALMCALSLINISCFADGPSEEQVLQDKSGMISANYSADVVVNESNVIRDASKDLLGVDCEYEFTESLLKDPGSGSTELSDAFKEVAKDFYTIPVSRNGGTPSQTYKWRNIIGPYKDRKSSINPITNSTLLPPVYGPVEWIKSILLINPNAKFIVDFNMYDTPQENAEYAQFLCAPADSKWGIVRAQYGLPDPVNVMAFELGNELDFSHDLDNDLTVYSENLIKAWGGDPNNYKGYLELYCTRAQATIDAVRNVLPDTKFSVIGKSTAYAVFEPNYHKDTSEEMITSMYWRYWTIGVIKALGKSIDYMTIHIYYSGYSVPFCEKYTNQYRKDVDETLPGNNIKFLITEHATWCNDNSPDGRALRGNLRTAEFLNYMYKRPDIAAMTYFGIMDIRWRMLDYIDNKLYLTGTEHLYKAYESGLGDRIVKSDVKCDNALAQSDNDKVAFTALATANGERGLNLILVNCSPSVTFDLNFEFENKYKLKEETVYTAPNIESYVMSEKTNNVFTTTTTQKDEDNFTTYKMPNKSMVILKLEANTDITGSADIDLNGDQEDPAVKSVFSDTANSWADSEINKMASLGFVKGVTEETFEPQSLVTRAEFATILSRTLSLKTDGYNKSFFDDVDTNAWYYGNVSAVYCEGLLRGNGNKLFDPDDNITLEELVTIVMRAYGNYKLDTNTVDSDIVLKEFVNKDSISDWATESIAFAVKAGIIDNLYENRNFEPKSNATRAQAAVIMCRIYNIISAKKN